MPRLFTGIEVPPDIAGTLAALRGGLPGARWSEPSDYHITLRFIGDVDRHTASEIAESLDELQVDPPEIRLTGLDTFGGARPHVVFAAIDNSRPLNELQGDHERLIRRAGLAPERRKYTPHVTLARLRSSSVLDVADFLSTRGGFRAMSFRPRRFVLYSAREKVGGGPYVVEAAYPF
ncbi:MAG TPA: RNA 2',3'-cyclic phosphodiesterase [Beijerinckiaceae bacterium]|nr:RNA 2',3'-cyclic phosphodiesterase [Beijerinckiaceae bacterium]